MSFFTKLADVSSCVMVMDICFHILILVEDNKRDIREWEKAANASCWNGFYFSLNGSTNH